MLRDLE